MLSTAFDDLVVAVAILVVCDNVEDIKASAVVAMNGVERIQIMEIIGNTLKKDFFDQEQSLLRREFRR